MLCYEPKSIENSDMILYLSNHIALPSPIIRTNVNSSKREVNITWTFDPSSYWTHYVLSCDSIPQNRPECAERKYPKGNTGRLKF